MSALNMRLCSSQEKIIADILQYLNGDGQRFAMIQGFAGIFLLLIYTDTGVGTGKTTVLRSINAHFQYYNRHGQAARANERRIVFSAAPTGAAALLLLNGKTLHSLFGLPFNIPADVGGTDWANVTCALTNASKLLLRSAQLIIIDECSMLTHAIFKYIDLVMQEIKENRRVLHSLIILTICSLSVVYPSYLVEILRNYLASFQNYLAEGTPMMCRLFIMKHGHRYFFRLVN